MRLRRGVAEPETHMIADGPAASAETTGPLIAGVWRVGAGLGAAAAQGAIHWIENHGVILPAPLLPAL